MQERNASLFIFLLLILFTTSCKVVQIPVEKEGSTYRIDSKMEETNAKMNAVIAPYKEELDKKMNKVIGSSAKSLTKSKPESTLGNFVADVVLAETIKQTGKPVDFAAQNYGGLRIAELPEGDLTIGKIFELMPFENFCVVLEIEGAELMKFFERIADYGGWPVSSGVHFEIKGGAPQNIFINGEVIDMKRTYHIALPDYVANGGDKCAFFKELPRENTNLLIRDMIIEYIETLSEKGQKVDANMEGRIEFQD